MKNNISVNGLVNYHETPYKKVCFKLLEGHREDLVFSNDHIMYEDMVLSYSDIDYVTVSMSSRLYNPSVIAKGPISFVKKSFVNGTPFTVSPMNVSYSLDLAIHANDTEYFFESYSLKHMNEILVFLKERQVTIHDEVGVQNILDKHPVSTDLQRYLDKEFKHIAKKHKLDNPRGTIINE